MRRKWLAALFILAVVAVCLSFAVGTFLMDFTPFMNGRNLFHAEVISDSNKSSGDESIESISENDVFDTLNSTEILPFDMPSDTVETETVEYRVYSYNELIGKYADFDEAVKEAKKHDRSCVKVDGRDKPVWDNYEQFIIYINEDIKLLEYNFGEAVKKAKAHKGSIICLRSTLQVIWQNSADNLKSHRIKNVPLIGQMPELYRGCEVTSLAMLMNFFGNPVDKMTLAEEIIKDETPFSKKNGRIYFGNPNTGFVGDIYDKKNDGLGVYHAPVYELLKSYFPDTAVDLTGCEFSELYQFINKGSPVWVITTSKYKKLEPSQFETWITPTGDIKVTYSEHSVLITGYDDKYIYFNDPYKAVFYYNKADFIAAWEQMGRQAITIVTP